MIHCLWRTDVNFTHEVITADPKKERSVDFFYKSQFSKELLIFGSNEITISLRTHKFQTKKLKNMF